MFCFTVVDFGFAFKLHSSLKKETPLLQTPPTKPITKPTSNMKNKDKKRKTQTLFTSD